MEISDRHLKMIVFAVERWIEDLGDRADDLPDGELRKLHITEMNSFIELHEMLQEVILRE